MWGRPVRWAFAADLAAIYALVVAVPRQLELTAKGVEGDRDLDRPVADVRDPLARPGGVWLCAKGCRRCCEA